MKKSKLYTVVRVFLGLMFLVFGLNGFLNFIPAGPMPEPVLNFMTALMATGYMIYAVSAIQLVVGLMLVLNLWAAFALVLLAPITVNIILVHLFLDWKSGLPG